MSLIKNIIRPGRLGTIATFVAAALALAYLSFILPRLLPGDFVTAMYASSDTVLSGEKEAELMVRTSSKEGFGGYLVNLLTLEWGHSYALGTPVSALILEALPWSILLLGSAQAISLLLGFIAGVEGAWRRGNLTDRGMLGGMTILAGLPEICTGVMLLVIFSYWLGWFPAAGAETAYAILPTWQRLLDVLHHIVLPLVTLVIAYLPGNYLLVRNSMVLVLGEQFIATAQAKGLRSRRIKYVHAGRNALLPLVTRMGLRLAFMVTGAIVVETVFSYPGLGTLLYGAIGARDLPLVRGIVLAVSLLVLAINFVLEFVYMALDPRIKHAHGLSG
jgi:peptide/nickel transport system permease protein